MFMRTQRLFLRPVFAEDWRDVFCGIADEAIVRNLARAPWPYTEDDARSFCAGANSETRTRFAITLPEKQGAPVVGMIGFEPVEGGGEELGYWIGKDWQRRGFATEAVCGVVRLAEALGIPSLEAGHFVDNPASGKVLRNAGFEETGELLPTQSNGRGGAQVLARRYVNWIGENAGSVRPAAA
ncbi:GNAT family N-acetyltransferase [Erythrobacter alti]|uniref:GNAT family N-acetyltransferase n=1 Tax=Erythrobacter alti TaxID=1896145 RepID=UPI0030F38A11